MSKIKAISVVGGNKEKILAKTCRTCASFFADESILVSVFTEMKVGQIKFLIFDVLTSLKMQIKEDDGLPQKICNYCLDQLSNIQTFLELSRNSEIALRNHFKIKSESNPIIIKSVKKENYHDSGNDASFDFIDTYEDAQDTNISTDRVLENSASFHNNSEDDDDDEYSYSCWFCEKFFRTGMELKIHERKHMQFKCEFCDRIVLTLSDLNNHIRRVHRKPTKPLLNKTSAWQCEFCGEVFTEAPFLRRHIKSHFAKKLPPKERIQKPCQGNYVCPLCSKAFVIPSGLEHHLKLHDKSRKYRCEECNLGYTRSEHLQRHMNQTHLKDRVFTCKYCLKGFQDDGDRIRHIKTVHEKKQFNCKYCGKSIVNLQCLKNHERIHTGERPKICEICGKGFRYNTVLKAHQKSHTAEEHEAVRKKILLESERIVKGQANVTTTDESYNQEEQIRDISKFFL